jgi:uncharacterized membrane protein YjfL (UPF0719 family)
MSTVNAKICRAALALSASLAIITATTLVQADVTSVTTVNSLEYGWGNLLIQLSTGQNYLGVTSAVGGCTANNQSVDTLKVWASMAQSALLSGKRLKIYFTTCSNTAYINGVDLWN